MSAVFLTKRFDHMTLNVFCVLKGYFVEHVECGLFEIL